MLPMFPNKKKEKTSLQNGYQDRIANSIVITCICLQQRWATFMQRHAEQLSTKWKAIILSIFCLCTGGFSFFFIAKSLTSNNIVSFNVTQFKSTRLSKAGYKLSKPMVIITKEEYEKIEHFRDYIDSLAVSLSGKKLYDSILISRPGLIDSIVLLENIYQSQIKK